MGLSKRIDPDIAKLLQFVRASLEGNPKLFKEFKDGLPITIETQIDKLIPPSLKTVGNIVYDQNGRVHAVNPKPEESE